MSRTFLAGHAGHILTCVPMSRWFELAISKRFFTMTLVAVWRATNRLMAIADTRIVRSPGNVLTEHGPKLLPITIICKQPGAEGFIDKEVYRADVGFAYSGSTLSALAAHALSNTMLSKLAGNTGAPPPALNEVAHFVAGASAEYMREVGQLSGRNGLFSAIVFGWCPQRTTLRVFELTPIVTNVQVSVGVQERNLNPIKTGNPASNSVIVIGSSVRQLTNAIDKQLHEAQQRGDLEIVAYDAPKRALRQLISDGVDERVGGSIQQAWATASGFQVVSNLEPITPKPPSPRNAGLFILGFDTFELQTVGNYQVVAEGR